MVPPNSFQIKPSINVFLIPCLPYSTYIVKAKLYWVFIMFKFHETLVNAYDNLLITSSASYMDEWPLYCKDGLRLSNIALLTNWHVQHALHEGKNLKGCLYFIGMGNSRIFLSNRGITSKSAFHVCVEVFVESVHYHVHHPSDVENYYTISKTIEHTLAKDTSISLMKHGCFEYIETAITCQHNVITDNVEDNYKVAAERCKKLTI
jgi:hypothetical protein